MAARAFCMSSFFSEKRSSTKIDCIHSCFCVTDMASISRTSLINGVAQLASVISGVADYVPRGPPGSEVVHSERSSCSGFHLLCVRNDGVKLGGRVFYDIATIFLVEVLPDVIHKEAMDVLFEKFTPQRLVRVLIYYPNS